MIRVLLVDDEEPARLRLRHLLENEEDVTVVGEAHDGEQALIAAKESRPDLVFLDIQMPVFNGIEVAAALPPPRPMVIFCTAFDKFAVEAFEQHALDYLLKPVNRVRFGKAMDRVRDSARGRLLVERELEQAGEVQQSLYPRDLPAMRTLDYSGACRAARAVGGDYFDFLALGEGQLGIALGDVSGKGMPAGLLMAGLQGRLQSQAAVYGKSVADMAVALNRKMYSSANEGRYVTLFYGVYEDETRRLTYVNAGHYPPLLINREGIVRLETGGTVIGIFPHSRYEQAAVQLQPGDAIVLYTDGITEASDSDEHEYGEERLLRRVLENGDLPSDRLVQVILADLDCFTGGRHARDDVTVVVARVR